MEKNRKYDWTEAVYYRQSVWEMFTKPSSPADH